MTKKSIPAPTSADRTYCIELLDKLSPWLNFKTLPVGHRFSRSFNNQNKCFFVRSGTLSLFRQPGDILIEFFEAPTLRGIIPIRPGFLSVYTFIVVEPADIAMLPMDEFYAHLTRLQLWEAFARHMQTVASVAPEIIYRVSSPSVYEAVRLQLYELMSKPLSIRQSISTEGYIRGKTRTSRSAVLRILSDLKAGGYVVIENGTLLAINDIPEKY